MAQVCDPILWNKVRMNPFTTHVELTGDRVQWTELTCEELCDEHECCQQTDFAKHREVRDRCRLGMVELAFQGMMNTNSLEFKSTVCLERLHKL